MFHFPLPLFAAVGLAAALTGCAAGPPLNGESSPWPQTDIPQRLNSVIVSGQPQRIATHEPSIGISDRVVVFIHGVGSDSGTWRFMLDLASQFDVILVDLLGCGQSECPSPKRVGEHVYGPSSQARIVLEALRQRLDVRSPFVSVTLVGHSLGGAVILRMYADDSVRLEYADVLGHVDGVVLFAPLDVVYKPDPMFVAIAEAGSLEFGLGRWLGILESRVKKATYDGVANPQRALREEAKRTLIVLNDPGRRYAFQAMIRNAIPIQKNRPDWERVRQIGGGYSHIAVPVLIVWGEQDETLPRAMGYELTALIANTQLVILRQSMHALTVEQPEMCAVLIGEFIQRGSNSPLWCGRPKWISPSEMTLALGDAASASP